MVSCSEAPSSFKPLDDTYVYIGLSNLTFAGNDLTNVQNLQKKHQALMVSIIIEQ